MGIPELFALAGALLLVGVLSSKLSSKVNLPILLVFLAVGMIAGSDGLEWVRLSGRANGGQVNFFGTVAMCFILFSGGMNTRFSSVRKVLAPGMLLASVGVVLTALILGLSAFSISCFTGYPLPLAWCLLLGSLISSTDAAAVFAILRGRSVSLKGKYLQPLLEFESGSNDPTAYLLTILMVEVLKSSAAASPLQLLIRIAVGVLWGLGAGALLGFGFGIAAQGIYILCGRRKLIEYEGLYFVLGISIVLLSYGISEHYFGANGMMAAYVCGITMGNIRFYFRKGITQFNDGIGWLMQVGLFTVLGLLVSPRELLNPTACLIPGLLLSMVLIFIARPIAVWLSMTGSRFNTREKIFISWVGLRGAAPIMLATFPLAAGVENAGNLFNMSFFMVLTSMLVQGPTLMPLARRLGLAAPLTERARIPLELEVTSASRNQEMFEFEVPADAPFAGTAIAALGLPSGVLVLLLRRNDEFLQPHGDTEVRVGDGLLFMGDHHAMEEVHRRFFPSTEYQPVRSYEEIRHSMPLLKRFHDYLRG